MILRNDVCDESSYFNKNPFARFHKTSQRSISLSNNNSCSSVNGEVKEATFTKPLRCAAALNSEIIVNSRSAKFVLVLVLLLEHTKDAT